MKTAPRRLLSSPAAMLLDERDTNERPGRRERERDIGIYGEKENERVRGRGKEKERNRVRMCLHDCGEGPVGVSESIFGCGYSQCGYAVQILFGQAPEVWECGKAVLHNSLCRRFTRLDVARGHTRSGPVSHHLWRLIPEEGGFPDRINDVCLHRNFPSLSRRDQVKEKIVP